MEENPRDLKYTRRRVFSSDIKEKIADVCNLDREDIGQLILDGKIQPVISLNNDLSFDVESPTLSCGGTYTCDAGLMSIPNGVETLYDTITFNVTEEFMQKYAMYLVFNFRAYMTTMGWAPYQIRLKIGGTVYSMGEFSSGAGSYTAWCSAAPTCTHLRYDYSSGNPQLTVEIYIYQNTGAARDYNIRDIQLNAYIGLDGSMGAGYVDLIDLYDVDYAQFQLTKLQIADLTTAVADANNALLRITDQNNTVFESYAGDDTSWEVDSSTEMQFSFPVEGFKLRADFSAKAVNILTYIADFDYMGLLGSATIG